MKRNASRELARQDAIERVVYMSPDCLCGDGKFAEITSGTVEVFCSECGHFLCAAELDEPGAEQRVRY